MFMIDDVTYTAGCGKVLGYNVYRDGKLLKRIEPNAELRITDKAPSGKHTYAVSALYAGGESEATKSAVVTDINGVVNAIDEGLKRLRKAKKQKNTSWKIFPARVFLFQLKRLASAHLESILAHAHLYEASLVIRSVLVENAAYACSRFHVLSHHV